MFKAIFLIFASFSTVLNATVESDILERKTSLQPTINDSNDCSECNQDLNCPAGVDYITKQALSKTFYSMIAGGKPLRSCLSKVSKFSISNDKLNTNLSSILNHNYNLPSSNVASCLSKNNYKLEGMSVEDVARLMTAYMHTANKSVLDQQSENLKQIAGIDQLLGKKPLENFNCDEDVKKICDEAKSCGDANSFKDIVDFSMKGLNELVALKKQAYDFRLNLRISEKDKAEGLKDIQEKMKYIKEMLPWLKGDDAQDSYTAIMRKIEKKENAEGQKLLEETLKKQLSAAQEVLKKSYYKGSIELKCINNKGTCTPDTVKNFNEKIVKNFSDLNPNLSLYNGADPLSRKAFIENQETNLLLNSGVCVSEIIRSKKEVDEALQITAAAGVGLATWPLGGVYKLAQVAMRFYQTGSRVKGIGSIALLGAEAKSLSNSINHISKECEKDLNKLQIESSDSANMCAKNPVSTFRVKNLSSCIVNISLTTLPYALSLRSLKTTKQVVAEKDALKMAEEQKKMFLEKISNSLINKADKEELATYLSKLNLTSDEAMDIIKKLNTVVKSEKDKNRLKDYTRFVLSLKPEEQKLALEKFHEVVLVSNKFNPGGYVEKFYLKENKFYLYEQFKKKSWERKLASEGKAPAQASKEAEELARVSRSNLQNKFYACHSKTITPEIVSAAKRYTAFSVALGIGGTTHGFYNSNKDKLVDNKAEFVGKLSYDIAITYLLSKLGAKISSDPGGSLGARYMKSNLGGAQIGLIEAFTYSKLYGVSEEEANKKIEEVLHSKDAMKELEIFDKYIEKEGLLEKFSNAIVTSYKKAFVSPDKNLLVGNTPGIDNDKDLSNLTEADLDRPEIREKLVKAVLLEMNSGGLDAIISTGDKGTDRWVNDRTWSAIVGTPKSLIVGMGIFQVLCLGSDAPMLSLGVALGIQSVNQFLSGDAYYRFKKSMINQ